MSSQFIEWAGKSGKTYKYWLREIEAGYKTANYKSEAGNYGFAKRLPNGKFTPLYFGESDDLEARVISRHEKWDDAIKLGVTHVMGHTTPAGEQIRLAEERDLIEDWNPPLNVQHRQKAI